jgi:hypothetical protein
MTNPQQKIDEYHLLKPYRLNLVTGFELTRRYLNQGFELELTIHMTSSSYAEIGDEELLLSFVGVRNLELTELGASSKVPGDSKRVGSTMGRSVLQGSRF